MKFLTFVSTILIIISLITIIECSTPKVCIFEQYLI